MAQTDLKLFFKEAKRFSPMRKGSSFSVSGSAESSWKGFFPSAVRRGSQR